MNPFQNEYIHSELPYFPGGKKSQSEVELI